MYDAWFQPVYRWVVALGGPEAEAEDLTQEIFLVVQRKLSAFDGQNLGGWLYRITANTVSDHRRRSWFRSFFSRRKELVLEEIEAGEPNAEELLAQKQERRRFYQLAAKLSSRWRSSFILFEIAGYSGEEIAAMEGIPAATVRTHLHRARKEFLSLVAQEKR